MNGTVIQEPFVSRCCAAVGRRGREAHKVFEQQSLILDGQPRPLAAAEGEDAALIETQGDSADAGRIQDLLAAGPEAWPLRLRELYEAVLMLSRNN